MSLLRKYQTGAKLQDNTDVRSKYYKRDENPVFYKDSSHPSSVPIPSDNRNKGLLNKTVKQSLINKAYDVASHPLTAIANSRNGIPDYIGKAVSTGNLDRNPLDMATDVLNPVAYANLGKDTYRDVKAGNYITAAVNSASMVPGLNLIKKGTKLIPRSSVKTTSKAIKPKQTVKVVTTDDMLLAQAKGLINKPSFEEILKKSQNLPPSKNKTFKSEIDWGKWNKEIPVNKGLMEEYLDIETKSKANGTWMKNRDGSRFEGTPEQFVQQQSSNFKKFYEGSKVVGEKGEPLFMYHGSPSKNIESFLTPGQEGYKKSPTTTTGGAGIYFTDKKDYADQYQNFADIKNLKGKTYQTYLAPRTAITVGERGDKGILDGLPPSFLWNHGPVPADAVKAGPNMRKVYDKHGYEVAMENPNLIKSAIGNNGMFDMTNPNIYKGLVPIGVAGGAAVQSKKRGGLLRKL